MIVTKLDKFEIPVPVHVPVPEHFKYMYMYQNIFITKEKGEL